jgi:hypothetical protein
MSACNNSSSYNNTKTNLYNTNYDNPRESEIDYNLLLERVMSQNEKENQKNYYKNNSRNYSYDVSGYDENGGYVYGSIDVTREGGDGYVYDEEGNEKYIQIDWTGKGELEGYDDDGLSYELEVD